MRTQLILPAAAALVLTVAAAFSIARGAEADRLAGVTSPAAAMSIVRETVEAVPAAIAPGGAEAPAMTPAGGME